MEMWRLIILSRKYVPPLAELFRRASAGKLRPAQLSAQLSSGHHTPSLISAFLLLKSSCRRQHLCLHPHISVLQAACVRMTRSPRWSLQPLWDPLDKCKQSFLCSPGLSADSRLASAASRARRRPSLCPSSSSRIFVARLNRAFADLHRECTTSRRR